MCKVYISFDLYVESEEEYKQNRNQQEGSGVGVDEKSKGIERYRLLITN